MNATTDPYGRSQRDTSDLERQGDQIRANMDRTLDALERKFSPGQLLDRSLGFLRDNGSEFVNEVGDTVRSHPVPILLTAAGLVWLTASISRSRSTSMPRRSRAYSGHARGERLRNSAAHAGARARSTVGAAKEKLSESMHAVHDQTDRARDSLTSLVQEQPLALGALAVAAGALLGAALPMTEYENRMMGQAHDRTLSKAKEVGRQQYEKMRESLAGEKASENRSSAAEPAQSASERTAPGENGLMEG